MMFYKRFAPYFVVAVIGAMIGGGLVMGYGGDLLSRPVQKAPASLSSNLMTPAAQASVSDARNTAIVKAAQTVGPAVVGITNKAYARDFYNRKTVVEQGTGSGVIFDEQGYIATNYHVVQGAKELVVSLSDGRVLNGKVVGVDQATDLAVVKVDDKNLPVATFGDSDTLMVGEPAIAIGNPLGLEFRGSVTAGVISALNRSLEIGDRKYKLIQTDAAINPGNSGGALVNADGMVIGINSAKISVSGVEGMGFSIPINTVRPILQSIIDKGRVVRAYLGVGVIDAKLAERYGYDISLDKGLVVAKIFPGGPADKSGICKGDIILKVAGTEVNTVADLRGVLDSNEVGQTVEVLLVRNGQNITSQVKLEEMPSDNNEG